MHACLSIFFENLNSQNCHPYCLARCLSRVSVLFVNRIVRKVKKETVRPFLYYKTVRPAIVRKVKKETVRPASGEASLFLYYKIVRSTSGEASFFLYYM